jgi:hypothetical protein
MAHKGQRKGGDGDGHKKRKRKVEGRNELGEIT